MSWWCLYREWGGLAYNLMANKPSNQNLNSGYSDFIFSSLVYSPVCACMLSRFSCVWVFATLWTIAREAALSMGFFRQKYWRGCPCPPPGDLPNQGTEPASLTSPALAGRFFTTGATWQALWKMGILQARTLECTAIPLQEIFPAQGWTSGLSHCR